MALTKYNYNSFDVTPVASKALAFNSDADGLTTAAGGNMVLIKEVTASSDANISFAHGTSDVVLDSTYPIYVFEYINVHPQTDAQNFQVNFRDGSTAYDATKTTATVNTQHSEGGAGGEVVYHASWDVAESTAIAVLAEGTGNGNDECVSGKLTLFNPSSTTFVTHFISQTNNYYYSDYFMSWFVTGYCNVTAAIDGVQFTFSSGNIDAGTFKLYGIKDS